MPRESFEVIVGVSSDSCRKENNAIAEASRYLAYADQTDSYGYDADSDETLDWGIGIHFETVIENEKHLRAFLNEMSQLAKVESVERVGGEL